MKVNYVKAAHRFELSHGRVQPPPAQAEVSEVMVAEAAVVVAVRVVVVATVVVVVVAAVKVAVLEEVSPVVAPVAT